MLRDMGAARAAADEEAADYVALDSRPAAGRAPGAHRDSGVVREEDEVGDGDEVLEEYAGSRVDFGTHPDRAAAERKRAIRASLQDECGRRRPRTCARERHSPVLRRSED